MERLAAMVTQAGASLITVDAIFAALFSPISRPTARTGNVLGTISVLPHFLHWHSMIDIQLLRKDIDNVAARLAARKFQLDVAAFNALEGERKQIQTRTEELQGKRNSLSKQVGMLKGKGEDASAVMGEVSGIGDELKASATRLEEVQAQLSDFLLTVPNLPHESVPAGADESGNVEVRKVGTPPVFDFEVKDHVDVGAASCTGAVHARYAYAGTRLHRVLYALHRQRRFVARYRPAAEV
jgi:seryl-tRNA synthetase